MATLLIHSLTAAFVLLVPILFAEDRRRYCGPALSETLSKLCNAEFQPPISSSHRDKRTSKHPCCQEPCSEEELRLYCSKKSPSSIAEPPEENFDGLNFLTPSEPSEIIYKAMTEEQRLWLDGIANCKSNLANEMRAVCEHGYYTSFLKGDESYYHLKDKCCRIDCSYDTLKVYCVPPPRIGKRPDPSVPLIPSPGVHEISECYLPDD